MQNIVHKKPASAWFFMKLSLVVIGVVFGGLVLWSVLAPIQGAVIAPGQITVEGHRKVVQHLEGGTVSEILVREGQSVKQGDIVVRLESKVSRSNLSIIDNRLAELYARRARLIAERDDLLVIPQVSGIEDVMALAAIESKMAGQRNLFIARADTVKTQTALLEQSVARQNERIAGLDNQVQSIDSQIQIVNGQLQDVKKLLIDGFAPKDRAKELEYQSASLAGERSSVLAQRAESLSMISAARLENVRLEELRREEAITELREVVGSITELEDQRISAKDNLVRKEIKAPVDGKVLNLSVHTQGGVIDPGQPLMEIVPDGAGLFINARIALRDIDKIQAGQSTLVRFTGFGTRSTPEADGKVRTVSADSIVDQVTGTAFYMVMIDLPATHELLNKLGAKVIVPGMPVETFIRTEKRSAISFLLKPLSDSVSRSLREE